MPISRDKVIAELNARKIGYSDDMEYKVLANLLNKARAKEIEKEEAKKKEIPTIPCGIRTINDHERRLCALEREVIPSLMESIESVNKDAGAKTKRD